MKKAVIFDMDGVLVDSEPLYYRADQKMFADLGVPFTQADVHGLVGVNSRAGAAGILERHPELSYSVEEMDAIYRASLLNALKTSEELCLIPGVLDWIKKLRADGYRVAVASSSTAPMVAYIMERFGLDRLMDSVINGEMVRVAKPDPEIFLLAAQKIDVPPEHCTVIEDSTSRFPKSSWLSVCGDAVKRRLNCASRDMNMRSRCQSIITMCSSMIKLTTLWLKSMRLSKKTRYCAENKGHGYAQCA